MTSFLSMEMKRMLRIGLQIKLLLKKSSQNLVEQNKHFLLFIDSVGQEIGCLMVERFVSVPQGLEPIQEALNAGIMSCIGLGIVWRHLSSCSWQLIWTNCWNTYTRPFCGTLASSHHGSLRIVKFLTKAAQGHEGKCLNLLDRSCIACYNLDSEVSGYLFCLFCQSWWWWFSH